MMVGAKHKAVALALVHICLVANFVCVANDEAKVCTAANGNCQATPKQVVVKVASDQIECGLWIAPSSLPNTGLGMYAGKDFIKNSEYPGPDLMIPMVDLPMHQRGRDKYIFLWDEYTWSGGPVGMSNEAIKEVSAASPGFGSVANSFLDLVNVLELDPLHSIPHNLHRSKDPGAGASTPYHHRVSVARATVKKGQELFVNYGQQWFLRRPKLGPIPIRGSLKAATQLFQKFRQTRGDNLSNVANQTVWKELWDTFILNTVYNESRVLGSFQGTAGEWKRLEANMGMKDIRVRESMRTQAWLQKFGTCGDNMEEGNSTIRQAGRGAFATRFLKNGSIVSQLPLIHVHDRTLLEMYTLKTVKKKRHERELAGMQMMLNYCYGHLNTTILLCPYGPIVNLVNHNQTRQNVKLAWSDPAKSNHDPKLLQRGVEIFEKKIGAKFSFDFVATRDIQPGEEIFLDYGNAFEKAWQTHVRDWKPVDGAEDYISAHQLNQDKTTRLRTVFEQLRDPYPGNVNVKCDIKFWSRIQKEAWKNERRVVMMKDDGYDYRLCDILRYEVEQGTTVYVAVATIPEKEETINVERASKEDYLKMNLIPREAFKFDDRPYTSDLFLPNAFRHEIGIPDDMFPEAWMNWSPA